MSNLYLKLISGLDTATQIDFNFYMLEDKIVKELERKLSLYKIRTDLGRKKFIEDYFKNLTNDAIEYLNQPKFLNKL